MRKNLFYAIFVSLGLLVSCTDDDSMTTPVPDSGGNRVVKTSITKYDGIGQIIEGENIISDIQACIFEEGKMTGIYNDIALSENSFGIQIEKHAGTLYVLANTSGHISLEELKSQNITEEEWLKKCIGMEGNAPVHFYSGSLSLDDMLNSQTVFPVNLKRGVARFDLNLRTAGAASVNSITLKNAVQSGALFPTSSEFASKDVQVGDMTVSFDSPLDTDTPAVLYAYEQTNGNLEISVDVVIDGKLHTLSKALAGDIKRNTIYTITVRKDVIDVTVEISFDEWEDGNDTELVPQVNIL